MTRRHNFQTLSWFNDLQTRGHLNLDPPYQRRSVWNQSFKNYFVETVLLKYPSPAIFLFEDISVDGRSTYHVVDGKQRLTTLFQFVADHFPVADDSAVVAARGLYFSGLTDDQKKSVWSYQFLVEYVPTNDESIIDGIFDRLNRNVAKLSAQELRHAKFDGVFINTAENLTSHLEKALPPNFPRIASQSRKQMKDVELVSLLLLLLEHGPRSFSVAELEKAFADRDDEWEQKDEIENRFRAAVDYIQKVLASDETALLATSRLRNQADFYSLFGAVDAISTANELADPKKVAARLLSFVNDVDDEEKRKTDPELSAYFDAARSASNDRSPRELRIAHISKLLRTDNASSG